MNTNRFPNLPVLDNLVTELGAHHLPLKGVGMVCVQHLVETTGSLFEYLQKLGLDVQNTIIAGKIYSGNRSVVDRLRAKGFRIIQSNVPARWGSYDRQLQSEVGQMWQEAAVLYSHSSVDKIVVLDDGGYALAGIPDNVRLTSRVYGVEQTMSGLALQEKGKVQVPVVQVASSATKLLLEPVLIQEAIFQRVLNSTYYRSSKAVGIVGLGNIGQAVLRALQRGHSPVFVYDRSSTTLNKTISSGVVPCSNLKELFDRTDCIFGCTGDNLLENSMWWRTLQGSRTLISCTSGDREFQAILNDLNYRRVPAINVLEDVRITTKTGEFVILKGGFPVNFDGSIESVRAADIQLTRALLLAGVIQATQYDDKILTEGFTPLMLDPSWQEMIVGSWFEAVPHRRKDYSSETLRVFDSAPKIARQSREFSAHTATRRELDVACR